MREVCRDRPLSCPDRFGLRHQGGVRVLVGAAVFKTVVAEDLGQGGSIPLRLRYLQVYPV